MDENTVIATVNGSGDISTGVMVGVTVPFVLAQSAVALRFWARRLAKTKLHWDDWLMLPAALASMFQWSLGIWWYILGGGRYIGDATPKRLTYLLINIYATEINWAVILTLVRASVLMLWRRLFPLPWVKYFCWVSQAANAVWFVAAITTTSRQCTPSWAIFYPYDAAPGACSSINRLYTGLSVSSVILDVAVIGVPLVICWRLQLTLRMKLIVSAMFATGSFVFIFTIVRLFKLFATDLSGENAFNLTWAYAEVGIWIVTESNVAIISGCLPVLRPVIVKMLPSTASFSQLRSRRWIDISHHNMKDSASVHGGPSTDHNLSSPFAKRGQEKAATMVEELSLGPANIYSNLENGFNRPSAGVLGPRDWPGEHSTYVQASTASRPQNFSLNRILVEEQIHIQHT